MLTIEFDDLIPEDQTKDITPPEETPPVEEGETPPATEGEDAEDAEGIKSIYSFLKSYAVIDDDDEEEFKPSSDELEKRLNKTKDKKQKALMDELYNSLHPDFRDALAYGLNPDASIEKYLEVYKPLEKFDLEKVEDQRRAIYNYYKATSNYSDDRIQTLVRKLEADPESFKDEAEDAYNELLALQNERKQALLQEDAIRKQREAEDNTKFVNSVVNAITASDLDDTRKKKVSALILNPLKVDNQETTSFEHILRSILQNPAHMIQLADLIGEYSPTTGIDLTRLQKKFETKTTNSFRKSLETIKLKGSSNPGKLPKEETIDLDKFLGIN